MAVVEMSARVLISSEARDPLLSSHGRCGISSFVAVLIPYYQEDDLWHTLRFLGSKKTC